MILLDGSDANHTIDGDDFPEIQVSEHGGSVMLRSLIICLLAASLLTGCAKNEEVVKIDPVQSTSVSYEQPSYAYYGPDSSTLTDEEYAYVQEDDQDDDYYQPGDQDQARYQPVQSRPQANTNISASSRTHVVAKGDSLYSLARRYYSDQARWKTIYEANRDIISNPDALSVGQRLAIP